MKDIDKNRTNKESEENRMNKKTMRISALCMAVIASCGVMSACRRSGNSGTQNKPVNEDATQFYVGLGTNGLDDWLNVATKKFEEKYADVVFEEGKKGVQVWYQFHEKFLNTETLPLNYTNYQEKFIITESFAYEKISKVALDITDWVTEPLSVSPIENVAITEETVSIADKMLPQYKEYYGKGETYYAVPAQEATIGIVYDIDLFDKEGLYFANDEAEAIYPYECENVYTGQTATYNFVDVGYMKSDLSYGPDGQAGTYDDGMPATYEEFFALCEYMSREFGIEPIRWSGKTQSYVTEVLNALACDFENEEFLLNTKLDGTASNLVQFDPNGKIRFENGEPVTASTQISGENGYELTAQKGYYYALKFLEALMKSDYYDKDLCTKGTETHTTTQTKYLLSKQSGTMKTIAMLVEGSWWQGEASGTFTDMAAKYGDEWSAKKRNFGYMPMPKYSKEYVGTKQSTAMAFDSTAFVTKDATEVEKTISQLFLKEMLSNDGLYDFTSTIGQVRPYDMTLTDAQYDALTGFGKSNYNLHMNTNIRFKPTYHSYYVKNPSILTSSGLNFHWSCDEGATPTDLIRSGYTANSLFEAIHKYWTKSKWDGYFA